MSATYLVARGNVKTALIARRCRVGDRTRRINVPAQLRTDLHQRRQTVNDLNRDIQLIGLHDRDDQQEHGYKCYDRNLSARMRRPQQYHGADERTYAGIAVYQDRRATAGNRQDQRWLQQRHYRALSIFPKTRSGSTAVAPSCRCAQCGSPSRSSSPGNSGIALSSPDDTACRHHSGMPSNSSSGW